MLSGGEGLVESDSIDSFSSTTSASFSAEAILGGISSDVLTTANTGQEIEAVSLDYQYGISLTSSFTGEDSLDVTIDVGNQGAVSGASPWCSLRYGCN